VSSEFQSLDSEVQWTGGFIRAGTERFRHADGTEVSRDKVWHPGAVGILALDDSSVWLTRQPREVIGVPDSLEIPAGKLDVPGESPLHTARRELAEEVGLKAARWTELSAFYTSAGFSDERVWLYEARELSPDGEAQPDEDERIEIVQWPLERLDEAIAQCEDAKSLVALLWLQGSRLRG
jgi:8-oxo-dGTP pyrophosphatase MutT (NUDIX family)